MALAASAVLALGVAACGGDDDDDGGGASTNGGGGSLSGNIAIDGSSTVQPFAQAAAEAFRKENSGVDISVGSSGTGGGFEKFCEGETDISDASRPIKKDEEVPVCEKNDVAFAEVQVANDGLAVVVNPQLDISCMTVDQLKQLWNKDSKVKNFKEIDPSFPDQEVKLYGAGSDSGTFDYFTEAINGEEGDIRKDYSPSEDDNITVQGVSGDEGGIGFFGLSYAQQNEGKVKTIEVDGGDGCVAPSTQTVQDGSYKPLSRPLFMYASQEALAKPQVDGYLEFIMENYESIAETALFVPLTEEQAAASKAKVDELVAGAGGAGGTETTE